MNAIQAFLSAESFAVAGASTRREKYGNKILRALMHPRAFGLSQLKTDRRSRSHAASGCGFTTSVTLASELAEKLDVGAACTTFFLTINIS